MNTLKKIKEFFWPNLCAINFARPRNFAIWMIYISVAIITEITIFSLGFWTLNAFIIFTLIMLASLLYYVYCIIRCNPFVSLMKASLIKVPENNPQIIIGHCWKCGSAIYKDNLDEHTR